MAELEQLLRDPLDTPITVRFRGATLQAAVDELSRAAEVGIAIAKDVPLDQAGRIDLDVREMPARQVLDWITRIAKAYYVPENRETVFITRDGGWAAQDRLQMRSYSVGMLLRFGRPRIGPVAPAKERVRAMEADEWRRFVTVLRRCLKPVMGEQPDARFVLDERELALVAMLPATGHAKLQRIIEEIKKPRKYEAPGPDAELAERAALLTTPVLCNFPRQDAREIAAEIGRRSRVNIGFEYERIAQDRREISLLLGQTTLGTAVGALAEAAGLGKAVAEPGRRVWILAKDQTPHLFQITGELPWSRCVVRSYYAEALDEQFGISLVLKEVQEAVTPGEWAGDLPVAVYHAGTGRLIVLHDEAAQREVAACIDRRMKLMAKPK